MKPSVHTIGFWSGLIACAATVGYCIVQLLQVGGVLHFPWDEKLIYGTSLLIVLPFLLEILALHFIVPERKKFWTHAALLFTTLYAVFVTANYVVQLATVIPMAVQGRLDEVRLLQQTPHSLFWNFDALGYIFMGLAAGAVVPVFAKTGFQKWVRLSLIAHALVTPLISIVYFAPAYSYRLLALGYPWALTAPAFMLMLAFYMKNTGYEGQKPDNREQRHPAKGNRPVLPASLKGKGVKRRPAKAKRQHIGRGAA